MCCTFAPAKLSDTIIYAGTARREGQDVHVLAYQNKAKSPGPNAMILPIPTVMPMGPQNVVDTREAAWFLRDMESSTQEVYRSRLLLGSAVPKAAQVFDSGSYTVVLAEHAETIPEALARVPEHKRPNVAPEFFAEYGKLYPGWPIAVCCWSGTIQAEPLLWWYVSKYPDWLFFPTVDAHDGRSPRSEDVLVDHVLLWGSPEGPFKPRFRRQLPDTIQELMPPTLHALRPHGMLPNGDYWVRSGRPLRRYPTGEAPNAQLPTEA